MQCGCAPEAPLSCTRGAACPAESGSLQLPNRQPATGSVSAHLEVLAGGPLQLLPAQAPEQRPPLAALLLGHAALGALLLQPGFLGQPVPCTQNHQGQAILQPTGQVAACGWLLRSGTLVGALSGFA